MTLSEILIQRWKAAFPDAQIELTDTTGTNDHWSLEIASELFKGLSRLKQHQAIYKPIRDLIDSNQVHALNITTYTPAEWRKR